MVGSLLPPVALSRIRVKNFRSLGDVDLSLRELTVLVGKNGVGKSNIIDALRFVRDALTKGLDEAVLQRGGMSAIRKWSAKGAADDVSISLEFRYYQDSCTYGFVLGGDDKGGYAVKREYFQRGNVKNEESWELESGDFVNIVAETLLLPENLRRDDTITLLLLPIYGGKQYKSNGIIYRFITSMGFHAIIPDDLRKPQRPGNPYPLEERGGNLASVLRNIMQKKEVGNYSELRDAIGMIAEGVDDISVADIEGYLVTRLHHGGTSRESKGPAFALDQESDGTLRALGILTALYQIPPRSLLTIEEPESDIHPGALAVFRDCLLEASMNTQLIVSTHSPDLIDLVPADALRVVYKDEGCTHVNEISESQKAAIKEQLFTAGELMRMEGLYADGGLD